jgi:glutaredoxin
MRELTLYTTAGCHLCEQAETLLDAAGMRFLSVDIEADLALLERYGVRIPVVQDSNGRELGWPFDGTMLREFVEPQ